MSGDLEASMRIRELDICERLKISRTPVREAFQRLELEGFLKGEPGRRGYRITSLCASDIAHTYDVTAALEGLAGSLAAARCSPAKVDELERLNAHLKKHASNGALADFMAANFKFHEAIHTLSGNDVLLAHLEQVKYRLYRYRMFSASFPGRMMQAWQEHELIIAAIRSRNPARTEESLKAHILTTKELLMKHFSLSNSLLGTRF